jgi:hypothetical protein
LLIQFRKMGLPVLKLAIGGWWLGLPHHTTVLLIHYWKFCCYCWCQQRFVIPPVPSLESVLELPAVSLRSTLPFQELPWHLRVSMVLHQLPADASSSIDELVCWLQHSCCRLAWVLSCLALLLLKLEVVVNGYCCPWTCIHVNCNIWWVMELRNDIIEAPSCFKTT